MVFKILHTETFKEKLKKLPKEFEFWVEKIEDQLRINPYVGDPINVPWFREKKRDKFRVYYLIYEDVKIVYLVAISEKKDQQKVINTVWLFLESFKEEVKRAEKEGII